MSCFFHFFSLLEPTKENLVGEAMKKEKNLRGHMFFFFVFWDVQFL